MIFLNVINNVDKQISVKISYIFKSVFLCSFSDHYKHVTPYSLVKSKGIS